MQLTFSSAGEQVPMDAFIPATAGPHPVIVVLHGSGGMWNPMYVQYAEQFTRFGYAVFVPHYFARTGTKWADDPTIERHFRAWMETITQAIDVAVRQPGVDAARV